MPQLKYCWARAGQKVKCGSAAHGQVAERAYTVTEVIWANKYQTPGLGLRERFAVTDLRNLTRGSEGCFSVSRFRPILERKVRLPIVGAKSKRHLQSSEGRA